MKTLRLSDEDYDELIEVLEAALKNAETLTHQGLAALYRDEARTDQAKAQRIYHLICPLEYEED